MVQLFTFNSSIFFTLLSFFLCLWISGPTSASVVIDGTRVIYPEEKAEVSVRMTNEGDGPKLVQVWIDDGDRQARPDTINVPFVVLTPIFRMDPKKGQVTRIQYTDSRPTPKDRESVFWLNVLEIPPKPSAKEQEENYLQFRYRTRIKLFFRPKGLAGTAVGAPDELIFKYKPGTIQLENPTAFHLSISSVEIGPGGEGGKLESQMLAPFSVKAFELDEKFKSLNSPNITFKVINDFGGAPVREKSASSF